MGGVEAFVGDHVCESDQLDFIAELVFSRDDFARLVEVIFLKWSVRRVLRLSSHLQRDVGHLLHRR